MHLLVREEKPSPYIQASSCDPGDMVLDYRIKGLVIDAARGQVSSKFHIISPSCPWPYSAFTVQKKWPHTLFSALHFLYRSQGTIKYALASIIRK